MFDSTLNPLWQRYILAVQEEVKPALGCTEPISLALAAGKVSVKIQEPCNEILFSRAKVWNGEKWACVTIVGGHTNIVHIETHDGVGAESVPSCAYPATGH